jgi:protein-L-isoaspartate(D-aspartate) O-methyltransferase
MTDELKPWFSYFPLVLFLGLFGSSFLLAEDFQVQPEGEPYEGLLTEPASEEGWTPPRTADRQEERARMVERQIAARGITDPETLLAMKNVPRHWFVPKSQSAGAYEDSPLPIGEGQTISQPYIVALMTQSLDLQPDDKVLEIGTGSGYQAAVLSEITPHVFSIEIVRSLARRSAEIFKERGYSTIQVRHGDGYLGWEEEAPFDAIIVTCAPNDIPEPLIEQLKPGGKMCIPVGDTPWTQRLVLAVKREDGSLERETIELVRFVPMTGRAQEE